MSRIEASDEAGPVEPGGGAGVWRDRLAGAAILVVWVGVLTLALTGYAGLVPVTLSGLALYLLLQAGRLTRTAWLHLGAGAGIAAFAAWHLDTPQAALVEALNRAAFLAALFSALGALREAARTSETVLATGRLLASQPPGRRYAAMTLGGTFFGAILNFGAVGLLSGMVRDANTLEAAGGDARIQAIRERRMLLAVLRGFSVLMFWCPLTVAYAIVTTTVVGATWPSMFLLGSLAMLLVLALGWFLDRVTMPRPPARLQAEPFAWRGFAPLFGLLVLVFALSFLVETTTQGYLVHGVILVVPLIALAWIARTSGCRHSAARMGGYLSNTVPQQRGEIVVLSNAAFVGAVIAALLPQSGIAAVLSQIGVPAPAIPAAVPWLVVGAGLLGANSLITVTVLAALVADPASLGVDPTVFGVSLVIGWGMAVGSSPAAAATMMIGRLTGRTASAVGWGWNGSFTLWALLLSSALLGLLHLVW